MTNKEIRARLDRLANGGKLTQDEQLEILKSLLRANQRIQIARKLGFEPEQSKTTLPPWDQWVDTEDGEDDEIFAGEHGDDEVRM